MELDEDLYWMQLLGDVYKEALEDSTINLYSILNIKVSNKSTVKPERVRTAYAKLSQRFFPKYEVNDDDRPVDLQECKDQEKKFFLLMMAFLVLKENESKRIYDTHGYLKLIESEKFFEVPVFDRDPYIEYENFFDGVCPLDREFLLLNGPNDFDSSDEELEVEEEPIILTKNDEKTPSGGVNEAIDTEEVKMPKPPATLGAYALRAEEHKSSPFDLWKDKISK